MEFLKYDNFGYAGSSLLLIFSSYGQATPFAVFIAFIQSISSLAKSLSRGHRGPVVAAAAELPEL